MILRPKLLLIWLATAGSVATGQQPTSPMPQVEIKYCGMKPGRPPLSYLSFNITVRNSANKPQWFLFPAALYDKAQTGRENAGIDVIELFADSPEHKVNVVDFMGTMKLQPDGAGGFKGLLLPAGAVVSVGGFGIEFWGEPVSPLSIRVIIADQIMIDGVPVEDWVGKPLMSAATAEVKDLARNGSKSAPDLKELPVNITQSGEIIVPDILSSKCDK